MLSPASIGQADKSFLRMTIMNIPPQDAPPAQQDAPPAQQDAPPAQQDAPPAQGALLIELKSRLEGASALATKELQSTTLLSHGAHALSTFDKISEILSAENGDIKELIADTREELLDGYIAAASGRQRLAYIMIRGVMEGLFSALHYRQQLISLNLWAAGRKFLTVHEMFVGEHEFRLYFKPLFEDEGFKKQYPNIGASKVFNEAKELYDLLSNHVHKKSPSQRAEFKSPFVECVERLFRVFLAFLEREEELPEMAFPSPLTYCAHINPSKNAAKENK